MRMEDDWYHVKIIMGILLILGLMGFLVYWFFIRKDEPPKPRRHHHHDAGPACSFEGEDLFKSRVYTLNGTLITGDSDTTVPCSNCGQYVYRTGDPGSERCVPMSYSSKQGKVCVAGVGASQACAPKTPIKTSE
jgi:hypothetical protein